jgi:hypothetical protein
MYALPAVPALLAGYGDRAAQGAHVLAGGAALSSPLAGRFVCFVTGSQFAFSCLAYCIAVQSPTLYAGPYTVRRRTVTLQGER